MFLDDAGIPTDRDNQAPAVREVAEEPRRHFHFAIMPERMTNFSIPEFGQRGARNDDLW